MTRKKRATCSVEQKLVYARLMVHEGHTNKKIMKISEADNAAASRWQNQYLAELKQGKKS